jgi:hypothetical protein
MSLIGGYVMCVIVVELKDKMGGQIEQLEIWAHIGLRPTWAPERKATKQ